MANFTGLKDAFGRMLWNVRRGEGDAIEIAERDEKPAPPRTETPPEKPKTP